MTKAESAASRTPRHYPAAFINSIAEEGTKDEAVGWLQRIWNERCTLELEASELRSCIKDLRERLAKAEKNAEKRPDTVHEFLADENGVVDLLPSGDVVPPNLKLTFSGETGELIKAEVIE